MNHKQIVMRFLGVLYLVAVIAMTGAVSNQALPPFPAIYKGSVFFGGAPAPDGVEIYAQLTSTSGDHKSPSVTTKDGKYVNLVVGPTDVTYLSKQVTFYAKTKTSVSSEKATETETFIQYSVPTFKSLDLHFSKLPVEPTPIPPFVGDKEVGNTVMVTAAAALAALVAGAAMLRLGLRRVGSP